MRNLARLPKVEKENLNVSQVAKYISTTGGLIDAENPTELRTIPSKNVIVTIDLQKDKDVALSSNNITLYDLAVMDSVYTLFKNGCISFTPEMIVRIMCGNLKADVSPQKAGAATKSLRKLAGIRVTLDCTEEFKARNIPIKEGEKALYTHNLLAMNEIQIKAVNGNVRMTGFSLLEKPFLYDYAERIGRIATVPVALLEVSGITDTEDAILVKRYVIQRVEELKRARNKARLKDIIYYDTDLGQGAMSDLWHDEDIKNSRSKKARLHTMILKVLEKFKEKAYIKGYSVLKEGKSVIGVEIEI